VETSLKHALVIDGRGIRIVYATPIDTLTSKQIRTYILWLVLCMKLGNF